MVRLATAETDMQPDDLRTATRRIEVFRPGTFVPMTGATVTMTAEDLKAIAAAYDPAGNPTPIVVGHPKTEDAAYGWAKAFSFDEETQRLVADCDQIEPAFGEAVTAGRYKRISLSLFSPTAPNNPKPGAWYPKHIGFLGAAAPAVSGLAPVHFAEDQTGVVEVEFGDPAMKDIASVFRSMREFIIEKFGVEAADRAAPAWTINWIDDAADRERSLLPSFTAPSPEPEPIMPTPEETAAAAARQTDLDTREAQLRKRESELQHADHASFAEALVKEGRLIPASQARVVALLDTLAAPEATEVSFAEGSTTVKESPAEAVKAILSQQPVVVQFGEFAGKDGKGQATVAFASPDGRAVDAAGLELLGKAQAWQKQNPTATLDQAIAAVSP